MANEKNYTQEELSALDPQKLHWLLLEKEMDFGKASLELQRRRSHGRIHVPAEEVPLSEWESGHHLIISPEVGFDIYNLHVFLVGRQPKTEQGRYHTHGDAVKYYLRGRGYEFIGDQRFEVKAGDFLHVPANIWHGTQNPNDEPLCFLAAQQYPGTFRQTPTPFIWRDGPKAPSVGELSEKEIAKLDPSAFFHVYIKAQMEFGQVLNEVQRRRGQKRVHLPAEDVSLHDFGPGEHMIIGPELGFDIYTFSVFLVHVPPRQKRAHTHGEAVKYYLSGRGYEIIGDKRFEVKAGDFIYNPANIYHGTENPNDEPIRFLTWQQVAGTFRQVSTPFINLE
ncbi:MAG: cupin domain-containing protein [Deltaproteobacteria bacterium]|nr:cupin domain-containing protein [Deltaproteobacteria bacterium]